MSNVKFKLNKKGVREVLKSKGVQDVCRGKAKDTLAKCGKGYEMHDLNYPERAGAAVYAKTKDAVKDNLDHNTLLKAVSG